MLVNKKMSEVVLTEGILDGRNLDCDFASFRDEFTSVPKDNMQWDEVTDSLRVFFV